MARQAKILVTDDDVAIQRLLKFRLERMGYEVTLAGSGSQCLEILEENQIEVMLLDIMLPDTDGLVLLEQVKNSFPALQVVMISVIKSVDTAVSAMKSHAFDYITKPDGIQEPNRLELVVRNAIKVHRAAKEIEQLKDNIEKKYSFKNFIGNSPAMLQVFTAIKQVAESNATVLIRGESGTGKELVAKSIHFNSLRNDSPFIDFNCAAVPENLFESELFGHEKGAFTGAYQRKIGRFEMADGGSIFLDEIGDMPLSTQSKILRVLQEREFERVGGDKKINVDVRVITATNRKLEEMVAEGTFREDLFYRISVFPINLPPLRERKEDVLPLTNFFINRFSREMNRNVIEFDASVLSALQSYHWPGNVRELENVIQRAVILCPPWQKKLKLEYLPMEIRSCDPVPCKQIASVPAMPSVSAEEPVLPFNEIERRAFQHALDVAGGNVAEAAKMLKIGRATMYRKVKEHALQVKKPAA